MTLEVGYKLKGIKLEARDFKDFKKALRVIEIIRTPPKPQETKWDSATRTWI